MLRKDEDGYRIVKESNDRKMNCKTYKEEIMLKDRKKEYKKNVKQSDKRI